MARVKRAVNAKKNHRKVLKLAKGYYGAKSKLYRTANQAVMKSLSYAYVGRKLRKSECYVMDKGYDSEEIHVLIREEIKADSIIPLRVRKRKKINGKYRKQLQIEFDKITYNRRNIVETIISVVIISVLKRKFGETLRARKLRNQVKEVKVKLIVYSIDKKVIKIIYIKLRISTEPNI